MAHFYGTIHGARGPASRLGTRNSGLALTAASWQGAVRVNLDEIDGKDWARVELIPWHGHGNSATLYDGPVNGTPKK